MKLIFILFAFVLAACQSTTHRQSFSPLQNSPHKESKNTDISQGGQPSEKIEMTQSEILALSRQFMNEDEPEKALEALSTVKFQNRNHPEYIKLKRDALQKSVLNLRYKARVLYEKSTQQSGKFRQNLLKECRRILEGIVKNYPEYEDLYSVKNNLKQIEQELRT